MLANISKLEVKTMWKSCVSDNSRQACVTQCVSFVGRSHTHVCGTLGQHSQVSFVLNSFLDSRHMVLQSSWSLKWRVFFQLEERTLRRSPPLRRYWRSWSPSIPVKTHQITLFLQTYWLKPMSAPASSDQQQLSDV